MEIRVKTPSEAFVEVMRVVASAPETRPRGVRAREVPERVSIIIDRPYGFVGCDGRVFNHAISVVEGMSLIGQCSVPELQTDRVKVLTSFQSGSVFRGAYGPRVEGALDDVVTLLKSDPDSRQAVLSIYDGQRDLGRWSETSKSGDVPCTLAIQFLIRHRYGVKVLDMWVVMRSNDAWKGLPYDLGQFSLLLIAVAQALGVAVGTYTHSAGSMHIYEDDYVKAANVGRPSPGEDAPGRFGGGDDFTTIVSRCRRILLGHDLADPTDMERALVDLLP